MTGGRTDRRDLLKKGAIGGAVAWTAPMVLSVPAASAATVAPGCEIVPTTVAIECGPTNYETRTTFDTAACPGSFVQLSAFNGTPVVFCRPIEDTELFVVGNSPFSYTFTMTLRDACNGAILAGPQDVIADSAALCAPPGNEPGALVDRGEAGATVTVTMGDTTITVPAG